MPNKKYKIEACDIVFARNYLINRAFKGSEYIERGILTTFRFHEFLRSLDLDDPEHDAFMLNKVCEKCLTARQWSLLKVSVRKCRERNRQEKSQLTIDKDAHKALKDFAAAQGVNLSKAILYLTDYQSRESCVNKS